MKKIIINSLIIVVILFIVILQMNIYEKKFNLQEEKSSKLEEEIFELSSLYEELLNEKEAGTWDHKILDDKNKVLVNHNKELEEKLLEINYSLMKNDLPYYWNYIWNSIYKSEGALSDEQIEQINFLLQPTFSYNDSYEVNPLSCFFTSYYEDVCDINLEAFLRYCPIGEVPEELPEREALSKHSNWPFGYGDNIYDLPVPIHRYNRELVQKLFTLYAGISLDELTDLEFEEMIFLESTDAYYNFTSDFGPGNFNCTKGTVDDNVIKLYGNSSSEPVLIIAKTDGKYSIKSFYVK